jgi:HEAT repeat protein
MKLIYHSIVAFAVLSCWLSGCNKPQPTLSGGKPTSYWVASASSGDKRLRKEAVTKLGNAGGADPAVVPALVAALHDSSTEVRGEAILALLKVGPDAKRAASDLEAMARTDRDAKIRAYAARALAKLR